MPIETINIVAMIRNTTEAITQVGHGFTEGQIVRFDNATPNVFTLAQADTLDNAKAVGHVSEVVNANEFVVTYSGRIISGVPADPEGTVEWLSDTVPGGLTTTAPAIAVRIMEVSESGLSAVVNIDWEGTGGGGGSVASVTGDSVDNTDPANPVVNAIPLSGTTPGNSVTGDIEIDSTIEQFIFQETGTERIGLREDVTNKTTSLTYSDSNPASDIDSGIDTSNISTRIYFNNNTSGAFQEFRVQENSFSDAATYPAFSNINGIRNDFNGLSAPTINDDDSLGYGVTSFRIYNGTIYICTDATTGAAVWVSAAGTPVVPIVSLTRAALQALLAGSTADTTVIYRVTDAVGSTLVLDVFATANNALSGLALDQTNLRYLFYNITANTVIDLYIPAIASVAQGDVIYHNGTSWVRLPAGTSSNVLRTGGSGANPSWALPIPCVDAGGTADAITADYTPNVTLADNLIVAVVAGAANATATPTFAPDGLTAHTIVKWGGQALLPGDIPGAQAVALLRYDLGNTRWELLNPAGFQDWIDWSASDNIVGGTVVTNNFRYRYAGYKKIECVVNIRVNSTGATFTFDLPIAAANTHVQFCAGRIVNNGTSAMGYIISTVNGVTVSVKTAAGGDPANASFKEYSQNFFIHTV